MIAIRRRSDQSSHSAQLVYLSQINNPNKEINIEENSECVDGIGGITWEGSLVMSHLLEKCNFGGQHILELGAGTGLCSLVVGESSTKYGKITCTDRFIDLIETNLGKICGRKASDGTDIVECNQLVWGSAEDISTIRDVRGLADVIFGAEIACLRSQHEKLVSSIIALAKDDTVVLMGFDEGPQPNQCTAEKEFDVRMATHGWSKFVMCTGDIVWRTHEFESKSKIAIIGMSSVNFVPGGFCAESTLLR